MTNEKLKELCNEMLYQIRGNYIEEHEQCEEQGHPDWQIAMHYLRLAAGIKTPLKNDLFVTAEEAEYSRIWEEKEEAKIIRNNFGYPDLKSDFEVFRYDNSGE